MTLDQLSAAATELLPCPFCGREAHIIERVTGPNGPGFFCAVSCYCGGYSAKAHQSATSNNDQMARVEAITRWNQRTGQLVAVADDAVERVARTLAPNLEGGREFDQMPKDRAQLRQWTAQGMCLINDATQDDATWLAQEAIKAAKGTGDE